ncbi:MAG TPA: DEAD/DEAH box helicase [Desulfobacterales bacterium]|nr:DEAD/DEAH box helicase [Desulfobacterales bacterium]
MTQTSNINEFLHSLKSSPRQRFQAVYHTVQPGHPPIWSKPEKGWPEIMQKVMHACGIQDLYRHQAEAIDVIRSGRHVVVATPTASGKTAIYNLPVLEKICKNANARALYIFPLKALAQDQLRTFQEMVAFWEGRLPTANIYDGDTTAWHRKRIRESPPNVILTNPEMLHLSILPYHQKWSTFLSNLEVVVVDEVHTYRGVLGSNMAQVFRRFQRICSHYGASPSFIFSSATVDNPDQLSKQLTGQKVKSVCKSGAPQGRRHILFLDPLEGPAQTAVLLLKAALKRGLRTIVYTQSRKLTELIAIWAGSQSGPFARRISAYRAGFLPEERREIEARLASGDLLAVISTSALELGIDIGDLDLCILVGYPGSVISTWQRGGRVGRSGQDSALVLIAGEDALDQYFMRNPEDFIHRRPEAAVLNPFNPEILSRHLICAAAELPLRMDEPMMAEASVQKSVLRLEEKGDLLRSADGKEIYSREKAPHRRVDLRGTGNRFDIISGNKGERIGEIDGFRAFKETHPGAVYLHKGNAYLVEHLDLDTKTAVVSKRQVDYYTRVRGHKHTEIIEQFERKTVWGTSVFVGRLKVTDQVTGYEKWRIHGKKRLNIVPLDLPPQTYETEGLWYKIPVEIQRKTESKYIHFMGGIHAVEHAAISIFPLLVMTDRNDLGGISTPFHFQVGSAAIFIYDSVPGGAGLTRLAFERAEELLEYTLKAIQTCPCESGCPSCVHSPKCGSGNRPIDKASARFILESLKTGPKPTDIESDTVPRDKTETEKKNTKQHGRVHFGVFDLETQRSAEEVGGWHKADLMGISCAVLYDSGDDTFYEFLEGQVPLLIDHLNKLDLVVGFNIKRFDYLVLGGCSEFDFQSLPTLDILEEVHNRLGFRISLDHLAKVTLGKKKSAGGLQALQWWKEGRIREIIDYCKLDVAITRDLLLYGKEKGYLLFNNKAGNTVRIPVNW